MRVSVIGFNWVPGRGIFLNDFLTFAAAKGQFSYENYIFGVIKKDGCWTGLLLRIKDQQRFAKITKEGGGEFTISEQALERNENPVEFNFFLINGATGRGIYQHYHHSPSVPQFTAVVNRHYDDYKNSLIHEEGKQPGSNIELLRKKYHGRIKQSYWVHPATFPELLASLNNIRAVEVEVETDIVDEPRFRPVREIADKERRRFVFSRQTPVQAITKSIIALAGNLGGDAHLKVEGIDAAGEAISLHIEDNMDRLLTLDFDDVVRGLVIKSSDLGETILKSRMANHLLAVAHDEKVSAMLGRPQQIPSK